MAYIARERERTGKRVTVTTVVGLVVARAMKQAPGLNGRIRMGTFVPHDTVDITFLVALEEGADLAKATVRGAGDMPMEALTEELAQRAARLRAGKDDDFEKNK